MTLKGVIKAVIAIAIIGAGAAIGWAIATNSNPYAPGANTTPQAAAAASRVANTPVPTFTVGVPAAAGAAGGTPGAGAGTGGAAGTRNGTPRAAAAGTTPGQGQAQGQGQRARPVAGTIESYDAATKVLTVKDATGQSVKYKTDTTRVVKSEKLSLDEFAKLADPNGLVVLNGDKGADGTYTARSLTAVELAAGAPGAGGFPGGAAANGTPGANAAPGGGGGGFGGGAAGLGGAGAVVIRGGKLEGQKFSGNSFQGEAITANLSDTTTYLKQGAGTADDLKAGQAVTVTARQAQGQATTDTPTEAITVTLN